MFSTVNVRELCIIDINYTKFSTVKSALLLFRFHFECREDPGDEVALGTPGTELNSHAFDPQKSPERPLKWDAGRTRDCRGWVFFRFLEVIFAALFKRLHL